VFGTPICELNLDRDRSQGSGVKIVMNPLIGMLANQLGGPVMQQLGQQIGADQGTTQSAVSMALPLLVGAMGNQATTPEGADTIHQVTNADDGSILNNIMSFVGNAGAGGMGGALLGQVLGGGTHNAMANALSQKTGLDSGAAAQLLAILTPIVIGAIGKYSQEQGGLDSSGISQVLSDNGGGNDLLGMAARAIDADGDGNVMEDIGNIINKLF
jgi:hypothetical protein